jgi:hypothetical protein
MTTEFKMPELPEGHVWKIEAVSETWVDISIVHSVEKEYPYQSWPLIWVTRWGVQTTDITLARRTAAATPSEVQHQVKRLFSDFEDAKEIRDYKNRIIGTYPPKETL